MHKQFAIRSELFLLNHPFYKAWVNGTLPLTALQDYARQYSHHVGAFPAYLENALRLEAPAEAKSILQENLREEDGSTHGVSHPELWLRFAEGLGVARSEVTVSLAREGGVADLVRTFTQNSASTLPRALGALFAYESQVPEIAESKLTGLRRHFHLDDPRALAFFEVHRTADVEHRESILKIINQFSPAELEEAAEARDEACCALWNFLTEICETNGLRCA